MGAPLSREFYARPPETVARELLGKIFVRREGGRTLRGRIVETEAYLAEGDEAAHGFKGKTKRNASLFKEAGHAYVHGMRQYCLLDLVTESADAPSSVLIRAVEPVEGADFMRKLRGVTALEELASGPAKFCMAFDITKEHDGIDVTAPGALFFVTEGTDGEVQTSGRIGISKAIDAPLRFFLGGNPHVSSVRKKHQ